jgi:hypothetical protein
MNIEKVLELVRGWLHDRSTTTPSNLEAAANFVAHYRLSVDSSQSAKYSALYFAALFAAQTTSATPHYVARVEQCLEEYYMLTR